MVKTVGKYQIGKTLGEGTFGKVKFAINSETNEAVAIKVLDKEKIQKQSMGAQVFGIAEPSRLDWIVERTLRHLSSVVDQRIRFSRVVWRMCDIDDFIIPRLSVSIILSVVDPLSLSLSLCTLPPLLVCTDQT